MLEHPEIGWIERTGYPSWMQEDLDDEGDDDITEDDDCDGEYWEDDEDSIYEERRTVELFEEDY